MRSRTGSWTAALAALGVLAGCTGGADPDAFELHPHIDDWPRTIVEVVVGDEVHEVAALVASVPERRQRGLKEVEEVPDGVGMLFVFDRDRESGFWMQDTLVPLEIAFAARDGRIVEIRSMEPCESEDCPRYVPEEPYRVALEVRDGWLSERGVEPGHLLTWDEVPTAR